MRVEFGSHVEPIGRTTRVEFVSHVGPIGRTTRVEFGSHVGLLGERRVLSLAVMLGLLGELRTTGADNGPMVVHCLGVTVPSMMTFIDYYGCFYPVFRIENTYLANLLVTGKSNLFPGKIGHFPADIPR
jgi:hypothetical protein